MTKANLNSNFRGTMMETQTAVPVVRPAFLSMLHGALGHRRTLLIVAGLMIVATGALNWGWLVAIGVAPLILSVLHCAVMCGLLCMKGAAGSCRRETSTEPASEQLSAKPLSPDRSAAHDSGHFCSPNTRLLGGSLVR